MEVEMGQCVNLKDALELPDCNHCNIFNNSQLCYYLTLISTLHGKYICIKIHLFTQLLALI